MIVKLFSTCKVVKGYTRGVIYDLGRNKKFIVPIELCDFISNINGIQLNEYRKYNKKPQYKSYIHFLKKNEIIFFAKECESDHFVSLNIEHDHPALIDSAVIIFNEEITFDLAHFISQVEKFGCENVVFFSTNSFDLECIEDTLSFFKESRFQQIEFIIRYNDRTTPKFYFPLFHAETRLRKVSLHSAPKNKIFYAGGESARLFTFAQVLDKFPEPFVDFGYFKISFPFFNEATLFNPYYNRKIFINQYGLLINNPYSKIDFGHIDEIDLKQIIYDKKFTFLWATRKDNIDVCKQCEFRYMCLDSRIPVDGLNNRLYNQTECNYNPYICKWIGEKDFFPLKECGIISNYEEFSINEMKLNSILNSIYSHE